MKEDTHTEAEIGQTRRKREAIGIDFDGVIHAYSQGWCTGVIYDIPVAGAQEALTLLSRRFRIVIYSARSYDHPEKGQHGKGQKEDMELWLSRYSIPYDEIHTAPGKPDCEVFIDDKGYRFEGDWVKTRKDIERLSSRKWATGGDS